MLVVVLARVLVFVVVLVLVVVLLSVLVLIIFFGAPKILLLVLLLVLALCVAVGRFFCLVTCAVLRLCQCGDPQKVGWSTKLPSAALSGLCPASLTQPDLTKTLGVFILRSN